MCELLRQFITLAIQFDDFEIVTIDSPTAQRLCANKQTLTHDPKLPALLVNLAEQTQAIDTNCVRRDWLLTSQLKVRRVPLSGEVVDPVATANQSKPAGLFFHRLR